MLVELLLRRILSRRLMCLFGRGRRLLMLSRRLLGTGVWLGRRSSGRGGCVVVAGRFRLGRRFVISRFFIMSWWMRLFLCCRWIFRCLRRMRWFMLGR